MTRAAWYAEEQAVRQGLVYAMDRDGYVEALAGLESLVRRVEELSRALLQAERGALAESEDLIAQLEACRAGKFGRQ